MMPIFIDASPQEDVMMQNDVGKRKALFAPLRRQNGVNMGCYIGMLSRCKVISSEVVLKER